MPMRQFRLLTKFVLLVLLFIAQPAATQTLLRLATPGALTGALPIYLGAKKGVFQRYGLTVEVIATRNEQMNMQALMSYSVQFLTSLAVMTQVLKIDDRESLENSHQVMKADVRPGPVSHRGGDRQGSEDHDP